MGDSFKVSLFIVAREVFTAYLRHRGDRVPPELPEAHAYSERHRLLFEALRSMPLDDRDLLELHYFENLGAVELAEIFDFPENRFPSKIRAARFQLRKRYREIEAAPQELDLQDDDARWSTELQLVARELARIPRSS